MPNMPWGSSISRTEYWKVDTIVGSNQNEKHCGARTVICNAFFFQAEDGIRDYKVTGVQTCALPISTIDDGAGGWNQPPHRHAHRGGLSGGRRPLQRARAHILHQQPASPAGTEHLCPPSHPNPLRPSVAHGSYRRSPQSSATRLSAAGDGGWLPVGADGEPAYVPGRSKLHFLMLWKADR